MDFIMEDNLIYKIGEALMIEIEEIEDLEYADKNTILLFTESGKNYILLLSKFTDK